MEIKEIRDFKKLSFVEQKQKLQFMKNVLYLMRIGQIGLGVSTLYSGYAFIDYLKNGMNLDSASNMSLSFLSFLGLSGFVGYLANRQLANVASKETIMELKDDELYNERYLLR